MGASTIVRYHHGGDEQPTEYRVDYHVEGELDDVVIVVESVTVPNMRDSPDFRYIFENSVDITEATEARAQARKGHTKAINTILEDIEESVRRQIDR